jgi:uncharacterized damage-inducible protein DinB
MPDSPAYSLAQTWLLNQRVNRLLLDSLTPDQLAYKANPRGRSIADQFAHLHNVRVMWLEQGAPAEAKKLPPIPKGEASLDVLRECLEASAHAVANLLADAEGTGKLKGFKRGPIAFLGYLLAHEGHHRGQIVLYLKQAGMTVDRMVGFGLWEWQKI